MNVEHSTPNVQHRMKDNSIKIVWNSRIFSEIMKVTSIHHSMDCVRCSTIQARRNLVLKINPGNLTAIEYRA